MFGSTNSPPVITGTIYFQGSSSLKDSVPEIQGTPLKDSDSPRVDSIPSLDSTVHNLTDQFRCSVFTLNSEISKWHYHIHSTLLVLQSGGSFPLFSEDVKYQELHHPVSSSRSSVSHVSDSVSPLAGQVPRGEAVRCRLFSWSFISTDPILPFIFFSK